MEVINLLFLRMILISKKEKESSSSNSISCVLQRNITKILSTNLLKTLGKKSDGQSNKHFFFQNGRRVHWQVQDPMGNP